MTVSRFRSWSQPGGFLYLLVCGLVESPCIIKDWLFQRCHTGGHAVSTSISRIQTRSLNLITAPSPSLVTHTLWRKQKICLKYDFKKKSLPFGKLLRAHVTSSRCTHQNWTELRRTTDVYVHDDHPDDLGRSASVQLYLLFFFFS